jgi:hypothetical protein
VNGYCPYCLPLSITPQRIIECRAHFERNMDDALNGAGYHVLRRGWPDRLVIRPDCTGCCVELKSRKDGVPAHQEDLHDALALLGVDTYVIRPDHAEEFVRTGTISAREVRVGDYYGIRNSESYIVRGKLVVTS